LKGGDETSKSGVMCKTGNEMWESKLK